MGLLADTFDPQTIFDWIQSGGIIGLLLFVLIGGARKWWVFGWQYNDLQERCKKIEESNAMWMQLALRGVNVTEKIITGEANVPTPPNV